MHKSITQSFWGDSSGNCSGKTRLALQVPSSHELESVDIIIILLLLQATASLQGASTVAAVTQAQKLLESLSWEGGYCPFSQPLSALNAHALLRLHRSAILPPPLLLHSCFTACALLLLHCCALLLLHCLCSTPASLLVLYLCLATLARGLSSLLAVLMHCCLNYALFPPALLTCAVLCLATLAANPLDCTWLMP